MPKIHSAVYMISVVSEMLGVHPQTLRLYEREGFVHPSRRAGVRMYSEDDVERIRTILNLTRDMGVNLAGVEVILSMREKMQRLQDEMEQMMLDMREEFMAELRHREEEMKHPLTKVPEGEIIKVKK
ncbi:MAG: heat shock protein transcriptional repressor HspR [Nitrospirota bacterium]